MAATEPDNITPNILNSNRQYEGLAQFCYFLNLRLDRR